MQSSFHIKSEIGASSVFFICNGVDFLSKVYFWWVMGIEEGTFWDDHWVLYGNQFDNKFHIKKNSSVVKIQCYISFRYTIK